MTSRSSLRTTVILSGSLVAAGTASSSCTVTHVGKGCPACPLSSSLASTGRGHWRCSGLTTLLGYSATLWPSIEALDQYQCQAEVVEQVDQADERLLVCQVTGQRGDRTHGGCDHQREGQVVDVIEYEFVKPPFDADSIGIPIGFEWPRAGVDQSIH